MDAKSGQNSATGPRIKLTLNHHQIASDSSLMSIMELGLIEHYFSYVENLKGVSLDGARAGLSVCRMVQEHYDVTLLMKVIIERDCVLELELEMGDRDTNQIQEDYQRKCFTDLE